MSVGEKEEDIYEDLCHFNSRSKQLQNAIHSLQPVEKRDYILKVSFDSAVFFMFHSLLFRLEIEEIGTDFNRERMNNRSR